MAKKWIPLVVALLAGALMTLGLAASCDGGGDVTPGDDGSGPPDDARAEDGARDEATLPTEPNLDDGVVADFVIDTLRIGDQDDGEGFNLDGEDTRPGHPYLPEDGPDGVDNQLGALIAELQEAGLDFNADEEIATSIADGDLLIVLRFRDVDDWADDPGLVYLYGYAAKDADEPEDQTNNLTGDGELLADERALNPPYDDLWDSLIRFENGVLHDTTAADDDLHVGDFHAGPSLFTVDIPVQDENILHLTVSGTEVVWDLGEAPTGDPPVNGSIINGLIGGYVFTIDAARALSQIDLSGTTLDVNTIRTILQGQADMDVVEEGFLDYDCDPESTQTDCAPGQTCEDDGGTYHCYEHEFNPDAISLGLVFTGISCRLTGIYDDPEFPAP
jgi:hypothetical protein